MTEKNRGDNLPEDYYDGLWEVTPAAATGEDAISVAEALFVLLFPDFELESEETNPPELDIRLMEPAKPKSQSAEPRFISRLSDKKPSIADTSED